MLEMRCRLQLLKLLKQLSLEQPAQLQQSLRHSLTLCVPSLPLNLVYFLAHPKLRKGQYDRQEL